MLSRRCLSIPARQVSHQLASTVPWQNDRRPATGRRKSWRQQSRRLNGQFKWTKSPTLSLSPPSPLARGARPPQNTIPLSTKSRPSPYRESTQQAPSTLAAAHYPRRQILASQPGCLSRHPPLPTGSFCLLLCLFAKLPSSSCFILPFCDSSCVVSVSPSGRQRTCQRCIPPFWRILYRHLRAPASFFFSFFLPALLSCA